MATLTFDCRDLAAKGDIKEASHGLELKIERINSEITLLKWMSGLIVGGIIALIIKAFFA